MLPVVLAFVRVQSDSAQPAEGTDTLIERARIVFENEAEFVLGPTRARFDLVRVSGPTVAGAPNGPARRVGHGA